MPSINVSSFNAISNINSCLWNYCVPAQTAAITTGWCTCGRNAGNTNGSAAGFTVGAANAAALKATEFNDANTYFITSGNSTPLYSNVFVQTNYSRRATCDLLNEPWCCCNWAAIPALDSATCTFCIQNTNYWTGGCCCAWTVPAGATYLRFEIWGAGAGSHGLMCCGMTMWGGSGAYASVIIPAVVGCTYTLCAGCSYVCSMYQAGITAGQGCASFVTGYGLSNFCAEGGDPSPYNWQMRVKNCDPTYAGICVGMGISYGYSTVCKGTYYGCCICSGGGSCFSGNCTYNHVPFSTSCRTFYGCVTNATNRCHFVIGTPGMFNSTYDPSGCGYQSCMCQYMYHPPITCYRCQCCNMTINLQVCCSPMQYHACDSVSYGCWPGMGGRPGSICGGTCICGGIAAGGMVRVSYTTTS